MIYCLKIFSIVAVAVVVYFIFNYNYHFDKTKSADENEINKKVRVDIEFTGLKEKFFFVVGSFYLYI